MRETIIVQTVFYGKNDGVVKRVARTKSFVRTICKIIDLFGMRILEVSANFDFDV